MKRPAEVKDEKIMEILALRRQQGGMNRGARGDLADIVRHQSLEVRAGIGAAHFEQRAVGQRNAEVHCRHHVAPKRRVFMTIGTAEARRQAHRDSPVRRIAPLSRRLARLGARPINQHVRLRSFCEFVAPWHPSL
jgi:hypothetical protein